MSREIEQQRCFKIPKDKLDLFLVKLTMSTERHLLTLEAEHIFDSGTHYDVIVNYFGSYPFVENEISKFAEQLNEKNPTSEDTK